MDTSSLKWRKFWRETIVVTWSCGRPSHSKNANAIFYIFQCLVSIHLGNGLRLWYIKNFKKILRKFLGWAISPFRDYKIVLHPGNIDGFSALTVLIPEMNTSLILLTNLDSTKMHFSTAFFCIDLLLGFSPANYNE